jgi:hypothetical protein
MRGPGVGCPYRLDVLERVVAELAVDSEMSANELQRRVGGRRADVLRCGNHVRASYGPGRWK